MATILFFGDSITAGAWDEKGGWVERIKQEVYTKVIATNFAYCHQIYNLGISGENTTTLVGHLEAEIQPRIAHEEGKVVIVFALGINDSYRFVATGKQNVSLEDFQKNLSKLVEVARNYTSEIMFVGLTPVDESLVSPVPWRPDIAYTNELVKSYSDALREFCKKENLVFVNTFDTWMNTAYKKLLSDGLHPTTKGHELLFETVSQTLKKNDFI